MTVSFSDITAMLESRKPINQPCVPAVTKTLQNLTEQGVLLSEEWQQAIQFLSVLQNKAWPQISHPRVVFYASNYGDDVIQTQKRLTQLAQQQDFATRLCAQVNADLRVYELDLSHVISADGISEEEAAHALSYGLMAVEEHVDCLIVDTLAAGSHAIIETWHKMLLTENTADPLQALRACGAGHDLFALIGAVLAARMATIPVFCGAHLGHVLPLALARLLPNEPSHILALPVTLNAPDLVQSISGLQQLQLILSLGPQQAAQRQLVTPRAA